MRQRADMQAPAVSTRMDEQLYRWALNIYALSGHLHLHSSLQVAEVASKSFELHAGASLDRLSENGPYP
jgi:hypothetical protein